MDTYNEMLNELGGDFDSFEADQFEVDNLVKKIRKGQPLTTYEKKLATKVMGTPRVSQSGGGKFASSNAVASFNMTVNRLTHTIHQTLPVFIGASDLLSNGYREALAGYLPAGVTLSAVQYGTNAGAPFATRVSFTFTEGVNTDKIEITCGTLPYPSFLAALNRNKMILSKLRINVPNVASASTQFSQNLTVYERTLFGKGATNDIQISGEFTPNQFQNGIVDIDEPIELLSNKGFIVPVIDAGIDSYLLNFTGKVQVFERL